MFLLEGCLGYIVNFKKDRLQKSLFTMILKQKGLLIVVASGIGEGKGIERI